MSSTHWDGILYIYLLVLEDRSFSRDVLYGVKMISDLNRLQLELTGSQILSTNTVCTLRKLNIAKHIEVLKALRYYLGLNPEGDSP